MPSGIKNIFMIPTKTISGDCICVDAILDYNLIKSFFDLSVDSNSEFE